MTSEDFVPAALRRLWRMSEPSRLGRRPALDVDQVVATAVDIADRDGLAGVTLPKVAQVLGFTGMSLYRHVGSKDELLALMADHALGPPPEQASSDDWREGLRAWAFAQRAVFQRRPWLTHMPTSGPPAGPNRIAWMEAALVVLAGTGLDWAHKVGVLSLVSGYMAQATRQEHELTRGRDEGQGQADAEHAWARALARLVTPDRFPQTASLFASTMFAAPPPGADVSADADFALGLDLILDGVAARIARPMAPPGRVV